MESTQIMSAEDTQAVANNAEDRAYLKDLHGAELPGQYGEYHHDIGSAAGDPQNAFVTPFDVKWDYLINYDHDFIGKKALLEIRKAPPRTVVTLEWDADDVGKVFASQFKGTEHMPTDDISAVGDGGAGPFTMSKVMDGEQMIGVATGRARDYYHRRMHFHVRSMRKNCAAVNKE